MTPEDRDLLLSLRQQQAELQKALERLNVQLDAMEARFRPAAPPVTLPPIPKDLAFPPIPTEVAAHVVFPPIPSHPPAPVLPPVPPPPSVPRPSFESHFGRWLTRIGAFIFVLFVASLVTWIDVTLHLHERIGAGGKVGLMGLVSMLVVVVAQRFERKKTGSRFFPRVFLVVGLAAFYITLYSAHFVDSLRLIQSPVLAGLLLFCWSLYVFLVARRKNSQPLAVFSLVLAYGATLGNSAGGFALAINLFLAAIAVVFLGRRGWYALPIVAILGTYLAVLQHLVIDDDGTLVLDTSRTLPFWPYAIYLYFAWIVFTVALIVTAAPSFRGGIRHAYLSLNNAGLAVLLALTAYLAGYGASSIGWTLLDTGFVFLLASRFAGFTRIEPEDVMSAYAAQGLVLLTAGIVVLFTGITRVVALLLETVCLGAAGAFAGDRVLTISTYVAAFFATVFSIWEIAVYAHHPWLLGFGGAAIMLINAWACRSEVRGSPATRSSFVISTACYCALAVALVFAALSCKLNDSTLPPALAIAALVLTFAIYVVSLFELPTLAQFLLLAALSLVLFPAETGEDLPWWSTAWVGGVTLVLVTWWSRQRTIPTSAWKFPLLLIYAFALVDLTTQAVRPWYDAQGWMVIAAFLSLGFLIYGAFSRAWAVAAAGQFFLALAVYHFFFPPNSEVFPWAWWAAAVPVVVIFVTARAALQWLRLFTEIPEPWRETLRLVAQGYQLLALFGLARWVFGIIPASNQMAAFIFLGTFVLSANVRHFNSFGVRCSFLLTALGMWLYLSTFQAEAQATGTLVNALAMLLFLSQPTLLRHEGKMLVSSLEGWILALAAVGTSWLFISAWFWTAFGPADLTMAWALYALFLFVFGLVVSEIRLRGCGVAILFAAIIRLFGYDFWGFSSGFRVLTLLILAVAAFGVGFIILRRDQRNTL